jgi:hypothetical protein
VTGPRQPWRDTVRVAADLALLGIVVTAAALPVLTAGAAVATGSAALHHFLVHDRWPAARTSWRVFRRGLLPGVGALTCAGGFAALLTLNLLALNRGIVPGGRPLAGLTVVLIAAAAGWAGLVVVRIGVLGGRGWRVAARTATTPAALLAAMGVVTLSVFLAVLVHPVLTPVLAGYTLFALHAVARAPAGSAGAPGDQPLQHDEREQQDAHHDPGPP